MTKCSQLIIINIEENNTMVVDKFLVLKLILCCLALLCCCNRLGCNYSRCAMIKLNFGIILFICIHVFQETLNNLTQKNYINTPKNKKNTGTSSWNAKFASWFTPLLIDYEFGARQGKINFKKYYSGFRKIYYWVIIWCTCPIIAVRIFHT